MDKTCQSVRGGLRFSSTLLMQHIRCTCLVAVMNINFFADFANYKACTGVILIYHSVKLIPGYWF